MPKQADLLLSVQRALLGAVSSSLRAVACAWHDEQIILRFVFDGSISDADEESMHIVASEVIADFHAPATIDEQIIRSDYPSNLNDHALESWAYIRKEPATNHVTP